MAPEPKHSESAGSEEPRQPSLLAAILECAGEAVVLTDRDSMIQYVNPAFEVQTGYALKEMLGRRPSVLQSGQQSPEFYRDMWTILLRGDTWRGRIVNRRKDGSLYTAEETITSVCDESGMIRHFIAIERDITDQIRAENALRESEKRFRLLAENMADIILTICPDGGISFVSPSIHRVCGYDTAALFDAPLERLFTDESCLFLRAAAASLAGPATTVRTMDVQVVRRDGSLFWAEAALSRLCEYAGESSSIVVVLRDITGRRKLEEDLRESQKLEAIGRLAAGVAHDFNNLLTVIQGYTALLLENQAGGPGAAKWLGEIAKSTERAASLTSQLLAFGRKQHLRPDYIDLNDGVKGIAAMLAPLLDDRIALVCDLQEGLHTIYMDMVQLEQVLMNLAMNAQHALPDGGVIRISTANLDDTDADAEATASTARDGVLLIVEDDGVGMAPDVQARIFEPFFTTRLLGQGSGLGLSTVYGIVKQSGGDITVESEPGKGTRFRIRLPAAGRLPASPEGESEPPEDAPKGRVLLVHRKGCAQRLLQRALERRGHCVETAADLLEAAELVRQDPQYDLVLAENALPRERAAQFALSLREHNPGTAVLLIQSASIGALAPGDLEALGWEIILKPYAPGVFHRKVEDLIEASRASSAHSGLEAE